MVLFTLTWISVLLIYGQAVRPPPDNDYKVDRLYHMIAMQWVPFIGLALGSTSFLYHLVAFVILGMSTMLVYIKYVLPDIVPGITFGPGIAAILATNVIYGTMYYGQLKSELEHFIEKQICQRERKQFKHIL